ncbi:MAG: hypothetical protein K2O84_11175 [Oscillospiraceae bacterium]|nr:hypothetical protein [Oscillospiraceae bacterium]
MGIIDIVLISISVISSVLSLFTTHLVSQRLKKIQRKKLPIVLSTETLNELVNVSGAMDKNTPRKIVRVQGKRVLPRARKRKPVGQKAETA